jgi:hypothetical protein
VPRDDVTMQDGNLAGRTAERDETQPRPEARGLGERRGQNISDAPGSAVERGSLRDSIQSPVIISSYAWPGPTIG